MRHLHWLIFLLILTACNGTKRVAVVAAKYPADFAKECADRFPVKDSIHTETIYKEGETIYLPGDTMLVDCDTVREQGPERNRVVRVPCPPIPVRVDTVERMIYIQVENTARIKALELDNARIAAEAGKYKGQAKKRLIWALIASGLIVAAAVLRFVKPKLMS